VKTKEGGGGQEKEVGEETRKRVIVKAITYRVIVTIALALISWYYSGNLFETSAISVTYTIIATVLYYVHERAWLRTIWGRERRRRMNKKENDGDDNKNNNLVDKQP